MVSYPMFADDADNTFINIDTWIYGEFGARITLQLKHTKRTQVSYRGEWDAAGRDGFLDHFDEESLA